MSWSLKLSFQCGKPVFGFRFLPINTVPSYFPSDLMQDSVARPTERTFLLEKVHSYVLKIMLATFIFGEENQSFKNFYKKM